MDNNFNLMKRSKSEKLIIPEKDDDLICWYRNLEEKLKKKEHHKLEDKIITKHICFLPFYIPASEINLKLLNKECEHSYEHIILIDTEIFKNLFDDDEKCALLLHELGHIFNKPKDSDVPGKNFQGIYEDIFADDYVRKFGFQKELLSSLEKLKEWKIKNDIKIRNAFNFRIERIKNNADIKVGVEI